MAALANQIIAAAWLVDGIAVDPSLHSTVHITRVQDYVVLTVYWGDLSTEQASLAKERGSTFVVLGYRVAPLLTLSTHIRGHHSGDGGHEGHG